MTKEGNQNENKAEKKLKKEVGNQHYYILRL